MPKCYEVFDGSERRAILISNKFGGVISFTTFVRNNKNGETMKGTIFKLLDVDDDPYGLWWTEDETITGGMLADWYQSYDDSDLCAKEGADAFEIFVAEIGYKIERVYVESHHVY